EIRRVRGAFRLIAAGVAACRQASPRRRITARCTVQRANYRSLDAVVETAEALGLDGVSFPAVDVTSRAFGHAGVAGAPPAALPDDLAALARVLDDLARTRRRAFQSRFIEESPAKLEETILRQFQRLATRQPGRAPRCNAPWVSAVVDTDGAVRPCF